jgi:hypothetical protein
MKILVEIRRLLDMARRLIPEQREYPKKIKEKGYWSIAVDRLTAEKSQEARCSWLLMFLVFKLRFIGHGELVDGEPVCGGVEAVSAWVAALREHLL